MSNFWGAVQNCFPVFRRPFDVRLNLHAGRRIAVGFDIAAGQVRGVEGGCGQVRQLGQVAADEAAVGVEVQRFGKRIVQTAYSPLF